MARYRSDLDDERDREYYSREDRLRREGPPWSTASPYDDSRRFENERRTEYGRGRFGERAEYDHGEPRYSEAHDRFRDEGPRSSLMDLRGDLSRRPARDYYEARRSRLRCRDIMTRDLVVATRDTAITQVAVMMKQEDTGAIPVVDYDVARNDKTEKETRNPDTRTYSRGKLVGLITDRDIVVRAVADGRDCANTRAEELMSTDIHTARPNDRVVELIRKMGDKQVRRVPIVNENGYLIGMISMADVATESHDDVELAEAVEDISKGSSFWNRLFG